MIQIRSLLTFLFIAFTTMLFSQISSVNYQLRFDTVNCRYDVYVMSNSGQALTANDRIQRNSQVTIITPYGINLTIDTTFAPYEGNIAGDGSTTGTPINWSINTTDTLTWGGELNNYYGIAPSLSPTGRYDNFLQGASVKIFSFSLDSIANCTQGVRLFENGTDPSSTEFGTGTDFNNGFTMGPGVSVPQLYSANSTQLFPPSPLIIAWDASCSQGIEIDIEATTSQCQEPLEYEWTGPDSYTSTTQDVSISPATLANAGIYKVVITDAYGCIDSTENFASSKPSAGLDDTLCAGSSFTRTGLYPSTGTWRFIGSTGGASLVNQGSGTALFNFSNSASGNYPFVYEVPGCSDTVVFTINPLPTVSYSGATDICVGNTSQVTANAVGTWVSNNTDVATIDPNTGVITGVMSGVATFTFTNTATGCTRTTAALTVNPGPTTSVNGLDTICIANQTQLNPPTGGTWTS